MNIAIDTDSAWARLLFSVIKSVKNIESSILVQNIINKPCFLTIVCRILSHQSKQSHGEFALHQL